MSRTESAPLAKQVLIAGAGPVGLVAAVMARILNCDQLSVGNGLRHLDANSGTKILLPPDHEHRH